jgi:predicted phage-related endonuclease
VDPKTDELVTHFSDHSEWTGVQDDDREGWLKLRQTMLTASDVAAVMGEDPRRSAYAVYVDKLVARDQNEVLALDDPRLWGGAHEQVNLTTLARYHGWPYHRGGALLRSREHAFLGCTLDAECLREGAWGILEGKSTQIPKSYDESAGKLPTPVLIQVHAQLTVTRAPVAIVFALLQGCRPHTIIVEPDPRMSEIIVNEAGEFMEKRVRALRPPDPTGLPGDAEALRRMFPEDDGSSVALSNEDAELVEQYVELNAVMGPLKRRKDAIAQHLKARLGGATYGVLPRPAGGKTAVKWKLQKREERVVYASESRGFGLLVKPPKTAKRLAKAVAVPSVAELLEASLDSDQDVAEAPEGEAAPIRFGKGRKRRR